MPYNPKDFNLTEDECKSIVQESPIPLNPVTSGLEADELVIRLFKDLYDQSADQMDAWMTALTGIDRAVTHGFGESIAPVNMAMAVASAQTKSDQLNLAIRQELLDSDTQSADDLMRFLRSDHLYDESRKSDLFARFFDGDRTNLIRAVRALKESRPYDAIVHLSADDGYLDAIKAPMAVRWCGPGVACLDTNVRQSVGRMILNRLDESHPAVAMGDSKRKSDPGTHDQWEYRTDSWVNMARMGIEGPRSSTDKPIVSERFISQYTADRQHARSKAQRHKDIQAMYGLVFHTIANETDIPVNAVPTLAFLYKADIRKLQTGVADAIMAYTDGQLDAVAINHVNQLREVKADLSAWDQQLI